MRWSKAAIVMKKDIEEARKTRYVMFSLILMPLVFAIFVPAVTLTPILNANSTESLTKLGIQPNPGVPPGQQMFEFMVGNLVFLFIIIPLATPSFIASYAVVGEKLNKSLEPLLAAPITDSELLTGKILASVVPAVIATLVSFVIFVAVTNAVVLAKLGIVFVPGIEWYIAVLIMAPILAFLSTVIAIIFSSRMNDIRSVQQFGAMAVLPIIGLFVLAMTGSNVKSPQILLGISAAVLIIDYILFRFARKLFQRDEILTNWK